MQFDAYERSLILRFNVNAETLFFYSTCPLLYREKILVDFRAEYSFSFWSKVCVCTSQALQHHIFGFSRLEKFINVWSFMLSLTINNESRATFE